MTLNTTEDYMVSQIVDTGPRHVELLQNIYGAGDNAFIRYRTGSTEKTCDAAGWITYTGAFLSIGFVQIRIESALVNRLLIEDGSRFLLETGFALEL